MKSNLASFTRQLKWSRYPLLRRFSNFEPRENFLICSGPRGGSTWLAELINLTPKTVILFEPLVIAHAGPFRALGFCWDQHIPEDVTWDAAKEAFEHVFRGKVLNDWTCMRSPPHTFLSAERMVIKFCHANALLPWLTRNFHFKYTPIFLIRHPFAVVASQLRHGNWDYEFSKFTIPDCPFREFYSKHADFLSTLKTKKEALVATWCLTHLVPLRNSRNNKSWITVYYENLLVNPQQEIERIFSRWQMRTPENILEAIDKPSATTREATFKQGAKKQLAKWTTRFEADELRRMMAVLEYFGVDEYGRDVFPRAVD